MYTYLYNIDRYSLCFPALSYMQLIRNCLLQLTKESPIQTETLIHIIHFTIFCFLTMLLMWSTSILFNKVFLVISITKNYICIIIQWKIFYNIKVDKKSTLLKINPSYHTKLFIERFFFENYSLKNINKWLCRINFLEIIWFWREKPAASKLNLRSGIIFGTKWELKWKLNALTQHLF